jgi:TPR repeat protein
MKSAAQSGIISFTENFSEEKGVGDILASAKKGDPDSQYSLGVMYSTGVGVEKNETFASYWYREASKKGQSLAQSAMVKISVEKETVRAEQQMKLSYLLFCADNKELDKDTLNFVERSQYRRKSYRRVKKVRKISSRQTKIKQAKSTHAPLIIKDMCTGD